MKEGSEKKIVVAGTARAEKMSVGAVAKTGGRGKGKSLFISGYEVVLLVWDDLQERVMPGACRSRHCQGTPSPVVPGPILSAPLVPLCLL